MNQQDKFSKYQCIYWCCLVNAIYRSCIKSYTTVKCNFRKKYICVYLARSASKSGLQSYNGRRKYHVWLYLIAMSCHWDLLHNPGIVVISVTCARSIESGKISRIIFFQAGMVTNPTIWLALSPVRIFLSLTTVRVMLAWVFFCDFFFAFESLEKNK